MAVRIGSVSVHDLTDSTRIVIRQVVGGQGQAPVVVDQIGGTVESVILMLAARHQAGAGQVGESVDARKGAELVISQVGPLVLHSGAALRDGDLAVESIVSIGVGPSQCAVDSVRN